VVAALAGCDSTSAPPPVGSALSGPIQFLVTSKSVDPLGDPVGVTAFYPRMAPSITAVVLLGQLHGPQHLAITWSKVTSQGLQTLFTRQLTVTSFGRAYSTAIPRGPMSFGTYRVTATVAGATRSATWAVFASRHRDVSGMDLPVTPMTSGPARSLPELPEGPSALWCQSQHTITTMTGPTEFEVDVAAVCPEAGQNKVTKGAVLATMSQPGYGVVLVGNLRLDPGGVLGGSFKFNVCSLPAGTDVPGAKIYLSTIIYYLGSTQSFGFSSELPAELLGPGIRMSSNVPPGTPVTPGEKIRLQVTATEPDKLGTQIGIGDIKVYAQGQRIRAASYPVPQTGCLDRGLRVLNLTYQVPSGASNTLKIQAVTSDATGAKAATSVSFPVAG
jgi:hypothetical protein